MWYPFRFDCREMTTMTLERDGLFSIFLNPSQILTSISNPKLTLCDILLDLIAERRLRWHSKEMGSLTCRCTRSSWRPNCSQRQSSNACSPFRARAFPQRRTPCIWKDKVWKLSDLLLLLLLLSLGDHTYITSAKELCGWSQRNGNFCWRSVLFMLTYSKEMGSDVSVHKYGGWVGGSEKVQKHLTSYVNAS